MKMRSMTTTQHAHLERALHLLYEARTYVKSANCPRLLTRLRSTLKSAEGARRHAGRRTRLTTATAP